MEKYFKKLFLISFTIGALFNVHAQNEQFYESWRWAHFTTNNGLPSDLVESIIETDDNTVWVSTAKGIAWYDGFRWNPVIVDSLFPQHRVRSITKYYKEKIFVILFGSLYIGDKKGFQKVALSNFSETGLITSVCSSDSTSFLCVYENADTSSLLMIKNNITKRLNLPPVGKIFKSCSTTWLIVQDRGIYKLTNNSWVEKMTKTVAVRDIVENNLGESIFAIDAPRDRIGIWEYKDETKIVYSKTERNQPVRTLDISNNGEVIVVYESGEIHLRNKGTWKNLDPLPREMVNIISVNYRNNNDLWVSTENGLFLFKRQNNLWTKNHYSFSDLKNVVMEIFKTQDGDIWIGNLNGIEIRKKNGKIKYIKYVNDIPLGLITGINQDNSNHIWISSGGGAKGIFEWDGKNWHHHFKDAINFHKIRKDNSGNLWFLGLGAKSKDPAGYILKNRKFLRIDSLYNLPSNRIYSFAESHSGAIWLGTLEGMVRIKNGNIKYWGKESLGKNAKIFTIAVDNNDMVWFSTFSPHLGKILQNDSIVWVWKPEEIYEYNQKVWDLSFDETGVLWAATTKGLFSYSHSVWSNYNNESGNFIRELRVVLPTVDKIFVGGHGIGMRTIERNKINIPIKIFLATPIVEVDAAHCSWEPNSYWNDTPSQQIETRYKLDNGSWSDWSTLHTNTFNHLPSGNHKLIVQANDSRGNIYESNNEVFFYIEPPIFVRPIFSIPFILLFGIIGILIIRFYQTKKMHKIFIQNQRVRIANDLHDEVGSNLGSIALISQRISRSASITKNVKEELSIISHTAIQTAEYLRDIVWYINPRYDNLVNMEARLREIATRMLRDVDVQFHINKAAGDDKKLIEIRRNILLMFKEILHNIIKHSKATKVDIYFERKTDSFQLFVQDNGIGFDQHCEFYGNGMRTLKKRAEEIGVDLEIKTQKNEGTAIRIVFKKTI